DRLDLWHERQKHTGTGMAAPLFHGARTDGDSGRDALFILQMEEVAIKPDLAGAEIISTITAPLTIESVGVGPQLRTLPYAPILHPTSSAPHRKLGCGPRAVGDATRPKAPAATRVIDGTF